MAAALRVCRSVRLLDRLPASWDLSLAVAARDWNFIFREDS
jgi:hypothetical protein